MRPGAFGFDNIACSLIYFFNTYENTDYSHSLAEAVHNGWRDNKPWLKNPNYFKPAKAIGDAQRNMCSTTLFDDLPEDEKVKDMIFVNFMKRSLE